MKAKIDFVTNSSSACYVILKENLTELQLFMIRNHIEAAKMFDDNIYEEAWRIDENDQQIEMSTTMDNFDMLWFLQMIGIDENKIKKR